MTYFREKSGIFGVGAATVADFVKYYLKHQEVVYIAPKLPIILGKLRIRGDFGAVYVSPPIQMGAELGLCCQTE